GDTRADETYTPAPADKVPNYFAQPMPCKISRDMRTEVHCDGKLLESKSLRELSILRNTIYARYGWDGYRKPWLRAYFHAQPWFKPNPKFSYKQLADVDRKNAHFIGVREQSLTDVELSQMRDDIFARYGKTWTSLDRTLKLEEVRQLSLRDLRLLRNTIYARRGRTFKSEILRDHFSGMEWYKPVADYSDKLLSANDVRNISMIKSVENEF